MYEGSLTNVSSNPWNTAEFSNYYSYGYGYTSISESQWTYSLQDALSGVGGENTQGGFSYSHNLYAFSDACLVSKGGSDCNASCNDTFGTMFDFLPTLHNCYIFGNVTTNMTEIDTTFASALHYLDDGQNGTATHVGRTLGSCLWKYCETLSDCKTYITEAWGDISPDRISFWTRDHENFAIGPTLVTQICSSIPARISSDVGGIDLCLLLDPDRPCNTRIQRHGSPEMDLPQHLHWSPGTSLWID